MVCDCMMETLECRLPETSAQLYQVTPGQLANFCDVNPDTCIGTLSEPSNGTYGAYSMCSLSEQLDFHLHQLYISSGRDPETCGSYEATVTPPQAINDTCDALLRQARPDGSGTITSYPAGTTPTAVGDVAARQNGVGATSDDSSGGLSSGAKAGIGVGVALGVLLLLGVVAFFLIRRRKAKNTKNAKGSDYDGKPELPASEIKDGEAAGFRPTMLDAKHGGEPEPPPAELGATVNSPAELPDPSWIPPEMPADEAHGGEHAAGDGAHNGRAR